MSKQVIGAEKRSNIKAVIQRRGLSFTEVGRELFPDNEYPYAAINRFFKGECNLKSDQLRKLSEVTGISLEELCATE